MDETGDEPAAKAAPSPPDDPLLAPRLTAGQVALLRRYGEVRPTVAGQELFREGDRSYDFIVILSGTVAALDHQAGVVRELATGGPGEFVAELNILTGERLFTTAVVRDPGSILVVPVDRVQQLIAQDQALADLILQTVFRRRQWLLQMRAGKRVDGLGVGGQIGTTSKIENYLGFPVGVSGDEFAERALVQVLRFGATLVVPRAATGLAERGDGYVIQLSTGDDLTARTVIIATGVSYRKLDAAGLDRFEGTGVFYTPLAAQDQVGPGDAVVIVGAGNSAGQAATWLADHGHPVTIVIRDEDLTTSMSRYLIDRIAGHRGIEVISRSAVRRLDGAGRLERVVVEDLATSTLRTLTASALFVLIGAEPHTQWLAGSVELDSHGFVVTGPDLSGQARARPAWERLNRDPYLLETSVPGVFAAGDVRSGSVKRVASAVGEGSIAIRFVSEHLGRRAGFAAAGPAEGGPG